jgi:hypothetical protein
MKTSSLTHTLFLNSRFSPLVFNFNGTESLCTELK